jgi:hypothetical protein
MGFMVGATRKRDHMTDRKAGNGEEAVMISYRPYL